MSTALDTDDTAPEETVPHRAPRIWRWLTGDEEFRRSTILVWLGLLAATIFVAQGTLRFDFREQPIAGDQASYLLQALSIEDGHNLSYDSSDMDRWREVGWVDTPTSLFFQRRDTGWAAAKPIGYSSFLAVFIAVFGVVHGVAVAGTALVLALVALSVAIMRTRYRGPVVPLVTLAFVFASNAYFYAYVIHEDLFLAVLTGALCLLTFHGWTSRSLPSAMGALALMAASVAEKPQFLALVAPVAIALVWHTRPVGRKVVLVLVAAAAFLLATFPYRHYSDGASWNAYQGDRFVTNGATPFDHPRLAVDECPPVCPLGHEASLTSVEGIRSQVEQGRGQVASFFYYFFGRYTGLLVFMPFALLALGVVLILSWRRLGGLASATLASIVAYVLLNVVVYPGNYYGGGQSLGDRYFLQMAPFVLLLIVAVPVAVKTLLWVASISLALGVVMLAPHHLHPSDAYIRIDRTSFLQRLLPVERNQQNVAFFRCPIYGDCAATAQAIPGFEP